MLNLWLVCDKHNRVPRWKTETNHWGIRDVIRFWRYGYRRIRVMTWFQYRQHVDGFGC